MKKSIFNILLISTVGFSSSIAAKDLGDHVLSKERFQIRLRGIVAIPDESSTVNIGGETDTSIEFTPEVDVTYFFTENIATELIAAALKHDVEYTGGVDLGKSWLLPPTLTLQYHFSPDENFSPYLGAGLNYSFFYNESTAAGFTNLEIDGGVGYVLQAGMDYWIDDHWGVNLDVKKLYLEIDAELNDGAIQADIDLDPWILGAGVSYRF